MDVDKTREIEEQVIFETLPVEQSPPNVISGIKRRQRLLKWTINFLIVLLIAVRGEKEQKLEVMSDSVTLKRGLLMLYTFYISKILKKLSDVLGRGRPRGSKKQNSAPTTDSLMNG